MSLHGKNETMGKSWVMTILRGLSFSFLKKFWGFEGFLSVNTPGNQRMSTKATSINSGKGSQLWYQTFLIRVKFEMMFEEIKLFLKLFGLK